MALALLCKLALINFIIIKVGTVRCCLAFWTVWKVVSYDYFTYPGSIESEQKSRAMRGWFALTAIGVITSYAAAANVECMQR